MITVTVEPPPPPVEATVTIMMPLSDALKLKAVLGPMTGQDSKDTYELYCKLSSRWPND